MAGYVRHCPRRVTHSAREWAGHPASGPFPDNRRPDRVACEAGWVRCPGRRYGLTARTIAECIPATTSWVGVILMPVKPARARPSRYSVKDSAPTMHPTWRPRSARSASLRWFSARMSETPKPAAGPEHAEAFGEDRGLVAGQVDHAVGDDHVDRVAGQRDRFDVPFDELGVGGAGLGGVVPGEIQHLLGHVQAVGLTGGADPAGGQQHVDAAAGAQVEDRLAGWRSATAIGLPQPRLADTASLGTWLCSAASYSSLPVPVSCAPRQVSAQVAVPPPATALAAWAYRARTCSRTSSARLASSQRSCSSGRSGTRLPVSPR